MTLPEPPMFIVEAVGQIALPVSDPDRSQSFYGKVLGLTQLHRYGSLVFFDAGNLRLMLSGAEAVTASSGLVYFRVADLEDAYEALKARGLDFDEAPKLIARMPDHELWMAFFKDPDGHPLALMAEKRG